MGGKASFGFSIEPIFLLTLFTCNQRNNSEMQEKFKRRPLQSIYRNASYTLTYESVS